MPVERGLLTYHPLSGRSERERLRDLVRISRTPAAALEKMKKNNPTAYLAYMKHEKRR